MFGLLTPLWRVHAGHKVKEKDVIKLLGGGTGFAGRGRTEAAVREAVYSGTWLWQGRLAGAGRVGRVALWTFIPELMVFMLRVLPERKLVFLHGLSAEVWSEPVSGQSLGDPKGNQCVQVRRN